MGQVITGKLLLSTREKIEERVKKNVNAEDMNFLAFLNYIVESNKTMSFGSATLEDLNAH